MSHSNWVKNSSNAITIAALISFPLMSSVCLAQTTPRTITTAVGEPSFAAFKPYWVDRPVMEVIGRATRELPPNVANAAFKFEATDKDANAALTTVTRAARSAIDRVQRLAGNKVDISATSTRQDFYEQYRDRAGNRVENARPDKLERSTITWTVNLKLTDTSLVPRVRAEMLNGVGSSEVSLYYSLVPTEAQMRDVMGLALDDGKERARQMSALHTGRTRLLVVQEGTSQCLTQPSTPTGVSAYAMSSPPPPSPPPPPPSREAANADGSYMRESSELVLPSTPSPTSLTATVCMVYALD